jgi:hypothetical protein
MVALEKDTRATSGSPEEDIERPTGIETAIDIVPQQDQTDTRAAMVRDIAVNTVEGALKQVRAAVNVTQGVDR